MVKQIFLYFILAYHLTVFAEVERGLQRSQNLSRIALVIGNSQYLNASLKNPVNDALDLAETLKSLNFEVITLTNASKKQMQQAIRHFGDQLKNKNKIGLFFFAGHGMQIDGENYLIPLKANIENGDEVPVEAISVNRILAKMETAQNNFNLLILDACRNNPYARRFRSQQQGLAPVNAPKGSLIVYSTGAGEVAADGIYRNSPFISALLKLDTAVFLS